MHLLFVADPIDTFVIYKDTTFAMMREAQARGRVACASRPTCAGWRTGQCGRRLVTAAVRDVALASDKPQWSAGEHREVACADLTPC